MSIIRVGGADNMDAIEKWRGGEGYDEVWIDEAKSHSAELLSTLIEDILEPRINWKNGVLGMDITHAKFGRLTASHWGDPSPDIARLRMKHAGVL